MKKLANLKGAKTLNKDQQKTVHGGGLTKFNCYPGTDPECCGDGPGQCGNGWDCGGYLQGYNGSTPICACV